MVIWDSLGGIVAGLRNDIETKVYLVQLYTARATRDMSFVFNERGDTDIWRPPSTGLRNVMAESGSQIIITKKKWVERAITVEVLLVKYSYEKWARSNSCECNLNAIILIQ